MKQRIFFYFSVFLLAALAALPLVWEVTQGGGPKGSRAEFVAVLNFLAWSILLGIVIWRYELRRHLSALALAFGLFIGRKKPEELLSEILREVNRQNQVFSLNLLQRRIRSKEEFSDTMHGIVSMAMELLPAESVELALFDRESGMYHSSFVVGKPFRSSAQAMLSGAMEEDQEASISPDVIVQAIAFSGSVLGSLRVGLRSGRVASIAERKLVDLLALQSGLAIINSQYTNELLRMKKMSDESVKAKTGFLANLSHELRGPLGIMLNAVELVLDGLCGPVNEDQIETLGMIQSNGAHLLELVNDVLDFAKIESGKMNPQKEDLLLHEVLSDITNVVRKAADQKSHTLEYRRSNEPLAISCDRRHLRQMLINLLTNAIKYTPDGGRIQVWAERVPGGNIKVHIEDTGIGIEASEVHKVFSAFERVDNAYSLAQLGTGLGMPLTKRLAEVNGGKIDFHSQPGKGSHFWLVFPSIAASELYHSEERNKEAQAEGGGDQILLVQRNDGERSMLVRYLSHIGFKTFPVDGEHEALEALRQHRIQLVLIDNNVVDSPESDIVGAIRESAKASSLPVVLVSSRAFVFDIEKYLRAGIDRCLIKPLELRELGNTLRKLIDGIYEGEVIDRDALEDSRSRSKNSKALSDPIH